VSAETADIEVILADEERGRHGRFTDGWAAQGNDGILTANLPKT